MSGGFPEVLWNTLTFPLLLSLTSSQQWKWILLDSQKYKLRHQEKLLTVCDAIIWRHAPSIGVDDKVERAYTDGSREGNSCTHARLDDLAHLDCLCFYQGRPVYNPRHYYTAFWHSPSNPHHRELHDMRHQHGEPISV